MPSSASATSSSNRPEGSRCRSLYASLLAIEPAARSTVPSRPPRCSACDGRADASSIMSPQQRWRTAPPESTHRYLRQRARDGVDLVDVEPLVVEQEVDAGHAADAGEDGDLTRRRRRSCFSSVVEHRPAARGARWPCPLRRRTCRRSRGSPPARRCGPASRSPTAASSGKCARRRSDRGALAGRAR